MYILEIGALRWFVSFFLFCKLEASMSEAFHKILQSKMGNSCLAKKNSKIRFFT